MVYSHCIWCQKPTWEPDYLGFRTFQNSALCTISCRTKPITAWASHVLDTRLTTPTFSHTREKDKIYCCVQWTMFRFFQLYIEMKKKWHICSFVEQVKLYRLVYDSIWLKKKFREKNAQDDEGRFFTLFEDILRGVLGRSILSD